MLSYKAVYWYNYNQCCLTRQYIDRVIISVGEGFSKEFEVKVRVHQGSVLSPLLFIIVLESLSCEFRAGVPWEDLYADYLVIIAHSLEECIRRLLIWKEAMEKKGLRINAGTQVWATTSSHIRPPLLQDTWPCIQLLRAERHSPCQWNFATDQDEPAVLAAQW